MKYQKIILLIITLSLTACGQTGPLYLPAPPPVHPPVAPAPLPNQVNS